MCCGLAMHYKDKAAPWLAVGPFSVMVSCVTGSVEGGRAAT